MSGSFRLALIQLSVGANKAANLSRAAIKVKEAASQGAQVVSLPECFNSPYGTVSAFVSIVMYTCLYSSSFTELFPRVC